MIQCVVCLIKWHEIADYLKSEFKVKSSVNKQLSRYGYMIKQRNHITQLFYKQICYISKNLVEVEINL
jgi:hypothetical protein